MTYAWIITEDHLAVTEADQNDAGMTGPSDAPDNLLARLAAGEGLTFKLFDDDGEHYYTGRILADGTESVYEDEEVCFAPLDDFGTGWAGCTAVTYPDRPDLDCG